MQNRHSAANAGWNPATATASATPTNRWNCMSGPHHLRTRATRIGRRASAGCGRNVPPRHASEAADGLGIGFARGKPGKRYPGAAKNALSCPSRMEGGGLLSDEPTSELAEVPVEDLYD